MDLNIVDVKKFMFLEDDGFKKRCKEEQYQDLKREEYRVESYLRF